MGRKKGRRVGAAREGGGKYGGRFSRAQWAGPVRPPSAWSMGSKDALSVAFM